MDLRFLHAGIKMAPGHRNTEKVLIELLSIRGQNILSVYLCLSSPSLTMCCSPNCETVMAATHHMSAWQTLIRK